MKKYWKDSSYHYKVFQNKLLTFHNLSDEGKQYLIKKFHKYTKKYYNLDIAEFKQLYKNFFTEYCTDLFQSGVNKKQYSDFKLKNPNFIDKINLKLPTVEHFLTVMFKDCVKFFYNNAKFITKPRNVIQSNINENIKLSIYKFLPLNEILILQKKVLEQIEESDNESEITENDNDNSLIEEKTESLEYLSEKEESNNGDEIDSFDEKLKDIYN